MLFLIKEEKVIMKNYPEDGIWIDQFCWQYSHFRARNQCIILRSAAPSGAEEKQAAASWVALRLQLGQVLLPTQVAVFTERRDCVLVTVLVEWGGVG